MGLGATSYNYLFLKSELSNNQRELMSLSNEKMALTRDVNKVSREYQEALSRKVLKWSTNAGSSYSDLSYNVLMKPGVNNGFRPYIISDLKGKTVIDRTYLDYAKKISPEGKGDADYDSMRYDLLAEVTGLNAEDIEKFYNKKYYEALRQDAINAYAGKAPSKEPFTEYGIQELFEKIVKNNPNDKDCEKLRGLYNAGPWSCNEDFEIDNITDLLKNEFAPYFLDKEDLIKTTADKMRTQYNTMYQDEIGNSDLALYYDDAGNYMFDFTKYVKELLDTAEIEELPRLGYVWYDIGSGYYNSWKVDYAEWEENLAAAEASYTDELNISELFTAEQENLLNFYDTLFSSIADNGWVYCQDVTDDEYLNQMFQNNLYTMTTVKRNNTITLLPFGDGTHSLATESIWENDYDTNIASNFENIFSVSDAEIREKALAQYHHKKNILNAKETKLDTRMSIIETENAAIKQMLESLEQIKSDNIERTMNIFS